MKAITLGDALSMNHSTASSYKNIVTRNAQLNHIITLNFLYPKGFPPEEEKVFWVGGAEYNPPDCWFEFRPPKATPSKPKLATPGGLQIEKQSFSVLPLECIDSSNNKSKPS